MNYYTPPISCNEEHQSKTYSFFNLRNDSEIKLFTWAKSVGIAQVVSPDKMHISLVSSDTLYDYRAEHDKVPVILSKFRYYLQVLNNNCLVLVTPNEELDRKHDRSISKFGIESRYSEYLPHITLSYNFVPPFVDFDISSFGVPNFDIYLDGENVEKEGNLINRHMNEEQKDVENAVEKKFPSKKEKVSINPVVKRIVNRIN